MASTSNAYHSSQYRWVPKQDKSNWWVATDDNASSSSSSYVNSHRKHIDTTLFQWKQNQGEDKHDRQHKLIQTLTENYISMVQKQENLHEQIQMLQAQVMHLSNCLTWAAWNTSHTMTTSTDESMTGSIAFESQSPTVATPPPTVQHSI